VKAAPIRTAKARHARRKPATRKPTSAPVAPRPEKALGFGLFATPHSTGDSDHYRPRPTIRPDLRAEFNGWNWRELLSYSRQLFAQVGILSAGVLQKNLYAIGEAWKPQFYGGETDAERAWGERVEEWLVEQWYPTCDVRGPGFDFTTNLYLDGIALDVDGDSLMAFTQSETGWPQLAFYSADRVASGMTGSEVKGGPFDGARMVNGCILNRAGRVIGFNLTGDAANNEPDTQLSAFNAQMLFEPEWRANSRGLPRIAKTLLDWFDVQDINTFLKRGVKLDASQGILHYNEEGAADTASDLVSEKPSGSTETDIRIEKREGGDILYLRANRGEKVESFMGQRPHPNVESFISRLERSGLLAVGWFRELIDPSQIGGASVRLIQDEARHSIRARQKSIRLRAKRAVTYAVAVAMKNKLIPRNDGAWWKWEFELPSEITVDAGYDRAADVEDLKLGLTTESAVNAKRGRWWEDTRAQRLREVRRTVTDAQALAAEFNIPLQSALDLLAQRSPNPTPIPQESK